MDKKSFVSTSNLQKQSRKETPSILLQRDSSLVDKKDELKICETNLINQFKTNNRLILSKETQEKIKKSLQIDGAAEAGFTERENLGRFFFSYNNNPFTQDLYKKNFTYDEIEKQSKTEKIDILNAQIKKKQTVQKGVDLKQKFFRLDQALSQFSRKISSHRMQINHGSTFQQLNENPLAIVPTIFQLSHQEHNYIKQLQNIVNFRQQKTVLNTHEDINIFKFLFQPKAKSFQTTLDKLLKYNFQTQSVIFQLVKQTLINPFNHISTYSRSCIISRKRRSIAELRDEKTELATNLDNISFSQILFLVAGKVRSEELFEYLSSTFLEKSEFQEAKVYLESRQGFNVYQPNQSHQKSYVNNSIQSIERSWVNLPYKIEYKQKMLKIKKIYQFCTQFNIQDETLNDYLNVRKQRLVCGLFDSDPYKFKSIDIKVHKFKRLKDGFQKNRNRAVTQVLLECKKFIKPRSKSKNRTQQQAIPNKISEIESIEKKLMMTKPQPIKIDTYEGIKIKNSPKAFSSSKNTSPTYSPRNTFQNKTLKSPKKNPGSFSESLSLIQDIKHKPLRQKNENY